MRLRNKLRAKIKTAILTTTATLLMVTGLSPIGIFNLDNLTAYAETSVGGAATGVGSGGSSGGGAIGGVSGSTTATSIKTNGWENWKQIEGHWAEKKLPGASETMGYSGCYILSIAIQMARSGVKTDFDPWDFGVFLADNGYLSGGSGMMMGDAGSATSKFTGGKFRYAKNGSKIDIDSKSTEDAIKVIQPLLDAGYYPVVETKGSNGSGTHFMPVDKIENGVIYVYDPGSTKTNTVGGPDDTYPYFYSVRIFEADVPSTVANGSSKPEEVTPEIEESMNLAQFKWDEGLIPGMPKEPIWVTEERPNLEYAVPSDWVVEDLDSLSKWKDEVKTEKRGTLTKIFRVGAMMVAILIILFSLLIASVFAFDKVNIFDFSLMRIITKDRMMVSPDGESTFFRGENSTTKLINLRDMIIVQCLLLGVALFLLSGYGYKVLVLLKDFLLNRR